MPETVRVLRVGGLLAWLMVGLTASISGPGRPQAFAVWLAGYLAFGVLFAFTRWTEGSRAVLVAMAAQAGAVIVMTATQCRGWEGTLLVLVAMQLGLTVPRRPGVLAVVAQSLALAWAIQHHWSPRQALLLTPPYLGFQVLAFLVVELLAREGRGRAELARTNAELVSTRELLAESARLNERLRIARELHDGMGHHLAALSLNLEALAQGAVRLPAPLETAQTLTRRLLDDVESVVSVLNADAGLDLGGALAALAASIPRPAVHVDADGIVVRNSERAHTLLRCCQEIVTNSVKHAQAANLWIRVRVEDEVVSLDANDDGIGAAHLGEGHGLLGMRQRVQELGGTLDFDTGLGAGFRLRATLPAGAPPSAKG